MPTSSVAVRSLALAVLSLCAASAAFAQGPNVTAFNPYSGVGLPGGPVPQYGPQAAYPIVDTVGPTAGGPAFNPWQPGANVGAAYPVAAGVVSAGSVAAGVSVGAGVSVAAGVQAPNFAYNSGAYLPAPPPGPIESRMVAIPELSKAPSRRENHTPVPTYTPPPPPAAPPVAVRPDPTPTPTPLLARVVPPPPAAPAPVAAPVAAAPAPPTATAAPAAAAAPAPPAATPAPAAPPARATAAVSPPLPPEPAVQPPRGTVAATIAFIGQSAELNDAARTDLDRLAKNLGDRSLRQIEIRAYAGGAGADTRKISLARALVVRSYLIDKGVKTRIEVGAFGGDSRGGGSDRVDILVPNS
jgi:outer membrane protein OmpA-like peptidoglycan-associated protein